MKVSCITFTLQGEQVAQKICSRLESWQIDFARGYGEHKSNLQEWTAQSFAEADALLFVGATGIAVRAIAPWIKNKTEDPAVLVMDESGRWVIPLLSGHIGGANRLACQLAEAGGGQAVLTTATDVRGMWAVDEWAARRHMALIHPEQIKAVSSCLLRGDTVKLFSDVTLKGELPQQVVLSQTRDAAQVVLSPFRSDENQTALHLVPPCITVGIGCRRGVEQKEIEALYQEALQKAHVEEEAITSFHSIDLKKDEVGLLQFCQSHQGHLITHPACELQEVQGSISSSSFVQDVTGVDTVCERSALVEGGTLLLPKQVGKGVTLALAIQDTSYSFEEMV